ncbi:MAG: glycosyltransferase family 39 protein, partial [Gemmatimonadetes bacterium]|nr:glycosyltransferase family 39 protein [Gemmatimonadota bacterium]
MRIFRPLEAVLVPTLAVLVVWAFAQLSDPYGLSLPLTLGAGVLCAGGLLTAWWRERTAEASQDVRGPDVPRVFPIEISSRVATIAMAALLVIAVALRFYGILDRPAWEDEMWTLRNFYTADIGELLHVAFDDYWPPLHYLILNTVARVADTSLIWLRTPSALFGCATVVAMYWLGRDLFGRRIAGVLAAMLVAGMTAHVLYSQEARVYSMHLFLAVLSAGYFYRSFHEKRISPAFLITTTLLTYSHSFASWYFIAGQCVYVAVAWLIWRDGEQFKKGFLSQLAVLLLWMPLVGAFAYSRLARDIVVPTYWATGPEDPMGLFDVVELYQSLAVRSWAGAAFLALFFALALVPLLPWWRDRAPSASRDGSDAPARDPGPSYVHAITFLLCWITVPVAFSYVVSMATTLDTFGVGASRYHLTVLPALCLLAVAGIAVVRSRTALVAVTLLLVLLPASQLKRHYRDFALDRPDVQGAVELVRT